MARSRTSESAGGRSGIDERRRENLGRLLVRVFDAFEREVLRAFEGRGIRLERRWLPVLRNVQVEGSRITEIADASGLAKQTVGPLVHELEDRGILRIDPDPTDGRAKLVRYTDAGLEGLLEGMEILRDTEHRFATAIGVARMRDLRASLLELLDRFE